MHEHKDSQMAQNSWREIAATVGKDETFVWFTNFTVLPDEAFNLCSHVISFPDEKKTKKTLFYNVVERVFVTVTT